MAYKLSRGLVIDVTLMTSLLEAFVPLHFFNPQIVTICWWTTEIQKHTKRHGGYVHTFIQFIGMVCMLSISKLILK